MVLCRPTSLLSGLIFPFRVCLHDMFQHGLSSTGAVM